MMRRVLMHRTRVQRRPFPSVPLLSPLSSTTSPVIIVGSTRRWMSSQPALQDDDNWSLSADNLRDIPVAEMTKAQKRKLRRRRINAARSVPYWLDNDIECFRHTMIALNLGSSMSKSDFEKKLTMDFLKRGIEKGNSGTTVLSEYRQLYKDSIVSFAHELQDNPETTTPNLEGVLDQLASAGFADLKWAKHFRKFRSYQREHQWHEQQLMGKTRSYEKRIKRLEAAQETLKKIKSKPPQQLKELTPEESKSVIETVVQVVSSLWDGEESQEQPHERKPDNDTMLINAYKKRLEKQQRVVEHEQHGVDAMKKQIHRLNQESSNYQPMLTAEEYEQAEQVVRQVLKDISLAFAAHIQKRHSRMIEQFQVLDAKTDLTKPHEWYQHARLDRRKIIFHGGPTNSGKTYAALQRLKKAEKGLYLGPLRLLAAEVYESLTAQGIYTSLHTGQERREVPFATHMAATVEIAPTTEDFDVVVIDEIQMMADPFRGFAWSRALLGMRCKEIHLCGGLEAENMVRRLAKVCGDEFEMKRYERFGKLKVAKKSVASSPHALGSYRSVKSGDCIVAFSRNDIFAIKREVERTTKHKCCVIYGSLPPETRTEQARLFNDPHSGYNVLVASDAIGMGLNLNIGRIIFNSIYKSNGESIVKLDHSSVKQISGRAGRKNSPFPTGFVTCRDPRDMDHIRKCMKENIPPIEKAGLLPTSEHIQHFSDALEQYELGNDRENLHKILVQFEDMAKTKGDFFICRQTPMLVVAKLLSYLPLSIRDKYNLCMAPVAVNNKYALRTLTKFAEKYASGGAPGLSGALIPKPAKSFVDLSTLCSIYSELELFLWLSARFPGNAVELQTAHAMKEEVISFINQGLNQAEKLKLDHCYIERDTKLRKCWERENEKEPDF